jgi:succinyl-CoA synthetase beta subunit
MSEGESQVTCEIYTSYILSYRGATPDTVKKAFEILLADPKVKSIFINIFGGMFIPGDNSKFSDHGRYHAM